MPVTRRKKNPVALRDAKPFPFMARDYPVKPWVNPSTQARFMTVSFRQDDGSFAAFIAEDESIWATGKTRREAEERVMAAYASRGLKNPAKTTEDRELEEDIQLALSRVHDPSVSWEEVKRKHGF